MEPTPTYWDCEDQCWLDQDYQPIDLRCSTCGESVTPIFIGLDGEERLIEIVCQNCETRH
jgi:DNA-directed RNA polymerase subunit RPC12/RpoP